MNVSHETFQATAEHFIALLERKDPHRTITARQIIRNNMMKVNRYENLRLRGETETNGHDSAHGADRGNACADTGCGHGEKDFSAAEWFRENYRDPQVYVELAVVAVLSIGCALGVIEIWSIHA